MTYIADAIGEDYKNWKPNETVFISSPTGSGKTYFILDVYLPYLAEQGKRMLYLVNRKILKEQMESEIGLKDVRLRGAITVKLYQTLENDLASENMTVNGINFKYGSYDCVVCDEAHYFMSDSTYNTNTILSYNFVRNNYLWKTKIFMSATIERVKKYIIDDLARSSVLCSTWLRIRTACPNYYQGAGYIYKFNSACVEYQVERDYSYLNIHIIDEREKIAETITEEGGKWLIFVDDKNFGKDLKDEISGKKKIKM